MNKLNELIKKQENLKRDLMKELKEKDKKKLSLDETPQIKEQLLARMSARLAGLKRAKQETVREYDEQIKKYEAEVKKIQKSVADEKKQIARVNTEARKAGGGKAPRTKALAIKDRVAVGGRVTKPAPKKRAVAKDTAPPAKKK